MKLHFTEVFEAARKSKRLPPDVAHPDHVVILGGDVSIVGPLDAKSRKHWETIKQIVKVAECLHVNTKRVFKQDPTFEHQEDLKMLEAHRRWVMRAVPKGWNWREDIYCRYSLTEETIKICLDIQKMFDDKA